MAQVRYPSIIASDLMVAALNFLVIKKVAETKCKIAMAGYVLGGMAGSVLSVWITTKFFGG